MRNYFIELILFIVLLSTTSVYGQATSISSLSELNNTIEKSPEYDAEKVNAIKQLKTSLGKENNPDKFSQFSKLYEAYRIFNYDSAYTYASQMQSFALAANDSFKIAWSKIKLSFILLSSGMFKEVFDTLKTINLRQLNDSGKAEYYSVMARCYYDLADYDKDQFAFQRKLF